MSTTTTTGFLQHGTPPGPFMTEEVRVRHDAPGIWHAYWRSRWRSVRFQMGRTFLIYKGERITIVIEGVS